MVAPVSLGYYWLTQSPSAPSQVRWPMPPLGRHAWDDMRSCWDRVKPAVKHDKRMGEGVRRRDICADTRLVQPSPLHSLARCSIRRCEDRDSHGRSVPPPALEPLSVAE